MSKAGLQEHACQHFLTLTFHPEQHMFECFGICIARLDLTCVEKKRSDEQGKGGTCIPLLLWSDMESSQILLP